MDAIIVNDDKIVVYGGLWIDTAFAYSMTKLNTQPNLFQRRWLKKQGVPALWE